MAVWWRPAVLLRDGWMARRGVNDRYSSERDDRDRTMPVRDLTNVNVTSPGTKLLNRVRAQQGVTPTTRRPPRAPSDPAYSILRCFSHANSGRRPVGKLLRNNSFLHDHAGPRPVGSS